jgi:hypothetical protein
MKNLALVASRINSLLPTTKTSINSRLAEPRIKQPTNGRQPRFDTRPAIPLRVVGQRNEQIPSNPAEELDPPIDDTLRLAHNTLWDHSPLSGSAAKVVHVGNSRPESTIGQAI